MAGFAGGMGAAAYRGSRAGLPVAPGGETGELDHRVAGVVA